jgi:hypothetical protein
MSSMRRSGNANLVLDGGVAAILVVALGVVYGLDRSTDKKLPAAATNDLIVKEHRPDEQLISARPLRLGVTPTPPEYDDMGQLLDTLGKGYKYTAFDINDLRYPEKIADYSVIFLTCGGYPASWFKEKDSDDSAGLHPGLSRGVGDKLMFGAMHATLRDWVQRGGTLYASDLQFGPVADTFGEFIDRGAVDSGEKQALDAEVVDPGLRDFLGQKQMHLAFDQEGWRPAAFNKKATTYLSGKYRSQNGEGERTAPLLAKFRVGDGTVIFTSFHNEKQNGETETKLLKYLVFSTVTAKVESQLEKAMQFTPQKRSLLSTTPENPTTTQTWHKQKPGSFQVALGFAAEGATLRLSIVAPNGKSYRKDLTSSLVVEIPDAPVGDWQITVEAVKLPYPNFPFTVTVGQ